MKRKWYSVYAFNGVGIYTNYQKVISDCTYMRGEHIKSFPNQEEAEEFARDGFIRLNSVDMLFATVPKERPLRINYFYFRGRYGKV